MPTLKVTNRKGEVFIIKYDASDSELVSAHHWYINNWGYATTNLKRSSGIRGSIRMHRLFMQPKGKQEVDHINGDKLDNRRENLRICYQHQNAKNRKLGIDNTSGFKGVSWHKVSKKFFAYISSGKRRKNLGYFEKAHDAARAYNEEAKVYYGEFAMLNPVTQHTSTEE